MVLIIGDFTARIGDPSGRSDQRPMLEPEQIDANATTFMEQAFKILDRDRTEVRFNSEWLRMDSDELFGLMSKATVAQLLERDDFQKRMAAGDPISALELMYPLLQGYDSVAIDADVEARRDRPEVQPSLRPGHADRPTASPQQSVMTMPILPGIDGVKKMSKSTGNYIGVTDPPEEMFGKVMRVPDANLEEYWNLLLERRPAGRSRTERGQARAGPAAGRPFPRTGGGGRRPRSTSTASSCATRRPRRSTSSRSSGDVHLPAALADAFGISRSEARRVIGQGGVKRDGEVAAGGSPRLPGQRTRRRRDPGRETSLQALRRSRLIPLCRGFGLPEPKENSFPNFRPRLDTSPGNVYSSPSAQSSRFVRLKCPLRRFPSFGARGL